MQLGKVLVIGGGIGGLTAAIALRRQDYPVVLIERDPTWSVYGVGIIQQMNVVRAMGQIGVLDAYLSKASGFDNSTIFAGPEGHQNAKFSTPRLAGPNYPSNAGIKRRDLQQVLGDEAKRLGVAQTVHFSFQGTGGSGVLASNENPPVPGGGSGGILSGGVSLDLQTNELSLDVGWGSFYGFTDLTSDITLLNIHGPTDSSGTTAWTQNAGVITTLDGYDPTFNSGSFNGVVQLSNNEVNEILDGRYYLHFHTDVHGGGEARGYFTVERIETTVRPTSFVATRGTHISGDFNDLHQSDGNDVVVQRNPADIQSRTELTISGTSVTAIPSSLTVVVEGAVFARSNVIQSVELFNFGTSNWEQIDSRDASRFLDSTAAIAVGGDLSRFVDPSTLELRARLRYFSQNPRQQFSSNTDQVIWIVGE